MREIAEEAALAVGVAVDEIELLGTGRRSLLRVTIDKQGGVTLDDCAAFSRDFSALMDVEDPIKSAYTLEVSSPGLDRPLKSLEAFRKCTGKLAKVVLKKKPEGKGVLVGRIIGVGDATVTLLVDGAEIETDYANVSKARLEVEL